MYRLRLAPTDTVPDTGRVAAADGVARHVIDPPGARLIDPPRVPGMDSPGSRNGKDWDGPETGLRAMLVQSAGSVMPRRESASGCRVESGVSGSGTVCGSLGCRIRT